MSDPESLAPRPPEPERQPFWTWGDLGLLALLAPPLLLAGSLLASPLVFLAPHTRAAAPVVGMFLFYALWFLALYALIRMRYGRPFWRSMGWQPPPGGLWRSALWGIVLAWGAVFLGALLQPPDVKTPFQDLLQDPVSLVIVGVSSVTMGPLCEELAFRGFLLPLLVRSLGATAGIAVSAAPFALLHGFQYAWTWQGLVVIFLAGVAFGWTRHRTGSTAASAVMHCCYNLVLFTGVIAEKNKLI